jgi:hypothetical protein
MKPHPLVKFKPHHKIADKQVKHKQKVKKTTNYRITQIMHSKSSLYHKGREKGRFTRQLNTHNPLKRI